MLKCPDHHVDLGEETPDEPWDGVSVRLVSPELPRPNANRARRLREEAVTPTRTLPGPVANLFSAGVVADAPYQPLDDFLAAPKPLRPPTGRP